MLIIKDYIMNGTLVEEASAQKKAKEKYVIMIQYIENENWLL
jgi:hypothetical protein